MIHDLGTKNNVQNQVANPIRGQTSTFEAESDIWDGEVVVRDGPQDGGWEHVGSGHVTSEKSLNAVILRQEFILYHSPCMYICVCMCMCVCMYLTL